MSIAVKSGLPSLGSTEGAVITKDDISVTEETSPSASAGEDLPRGKSAYEIAKENGFNGTETEWLASLKGATGAPGADGKNGENGKTPYVGDNGNWYIGADDTGKPSRGAKGDKGDPGATPNLTVGTVTTLEAGQNATASITGESPDLTLNLGIPKGADGQSGADGKTAYRYAVESGYTGTETEFAEKLAQEQLVGTTNELTPTQVYDAVSAGIPVKVQYLDSTYGLLSFTAFNVAESLNVIVSPPAVYHNDAYILIQLAGYKSDETWGILVTTLAQKADIPSALPNPNALTFTGAVNATYDGSTAVSVEIPNGGSGGTDISLGLTSAAVGQIIKVKAIDASGKPTAWEAANMPNVVQPDWNQNDDTQPDYVKNKPFYLEKTLFIELTKNDFTVNNQNGYIKYMYRSTPKLDWFTSAESIAFEIEIVDTNGKRYTATQDSIDVNIVKDTTYDDYEYWSCYSMLFEIVSGVDLDYYDDEYYYKDEWGVLIDYGGIEFSEINIKIYRVDAKKIPEICLDAAIGQTAITVGGVLEDSETEMSPSAIVPNLVIPVNPQGTNEEIYCDMISRRLRISGNLLPYLGILTYSFPYPTPTTAGASVSFDISSEGDTLWDRVGWYSPWIYGRYLLFDFISNYSGGGRIRFLSYGDKVSDFNCAVAASTLGHLYTVVFKYTNNYKTLNVTLKCVAE